MNITKEFIKNHPELLITKADKGNVTVAMEHCNCKEKMEVLSDKNTYQIINKDLTRKLIGDLKKSLHMEKQ